MFKSGDVVGVKAYEGLVILKISEVDSYGKHREEDCYEVRYLRRLNYTTFADGTAYWDKQHIDSVGFLLTNFTSYDKLNKLLGGN